MAVQPQTPYKEYTANGSTKSFALEFDCDNQDHLIVLVDDVEAIVGTWSLIGGAVVFDTAPTNGRKITIQRNTPFRRDGDFQSYDNSFRPASVNKGFDKIWWKIQELGVADWLLGLKLQKFRDDVNLTALENTLEEARQIRDETADSVTEVQSNVEQSQTLLANTTAQSNLAQGYADNASVANAAAQQAAIDVSTAKVDVYSALSAQQVEVNNSLTAIAGGHKAYPTLALAIAAQTSLPANSIVEVTNDNANNGTYQWNGTTLTKSAYDPLTQAQNYTDKTVKNNTVLSGGVDGTELAIFTDKNGRRTWIEVAKDGGMTDTTKQHVRDTVLTPVNSPTLAYAVTDKNGRRTWIEVAKDGGMTDTTKQHVRDTVLTPVNSPTLAYAVTDKNGRVLTSVSKTGEIYPAPPVPATQTTVNPDGVVNYNTYPFQVQPDFSTWAFYGSSWIQQMQEVIYNTLAGDIPTIKTPKFYGWGGAEFSYTNLATGFFNGTLTFGGGVIKGNNTATTPTAHTFKYGYPRIGEVRGQLENGIKGKVANGTFTATGLTSDFAVPSDLPLMFIADSFKHPNAIALIYHGKNNLNAGRSTWQQVVASARDATAALDSANNKHTLILGFTANTGSSDTDRDSVRNVNKYLKALYGDRFIDVESLVFADKTFTDLGITKTQADINAIARFTLPPSLSSDPLHLSAPMAQYLANHILNVVNLKGWY